MMWRWVESRRAFVGLAMAAAVSGCGGMTPDGAAEDMAKEAYRHLAHKEDAALEAMLIPAARKTADADIYNSLRMLIPPGEPASVKRTNWQAYTGTGGRRMTYQHAYDYGARVVVATTVLVSPPGAGPWKIQAFNINVTAGQTPPPAVVAGKTST